MWWIAAILAAGTSDAPRAPVTAERQAYAMVTIVKPAIVRFGQGAVQAGERVGIQRDSDVHFAGGALQPARLIEFP